jgi:hypothetical protein
MLVLRLFIGLIIVTFSSSSFSDGEAILMNGTHGTLDIEYQICTIFDSKRICTDKKNKRINVTGIWRPDNTKTQNIIITKLSTLSLESKYPDVDELEKIQGQERQYVKTCNLIASPIAVTVFSNEIFCLRVGGK